MSLRAIVKFGIGFVIFIGVAHVIMFVMFYVLGRGIQAPVTPLSPPLVQVDAPIVGPRLEVSPSRNWEEMKKAQERLLHGDGAYGWVSPEKGIVRIPVERAMELALQRGFAVRAATQPAGR